MRYDDSCEELNILRNLTCYLFSKRDLFFMESFVGYVELIAGFR